MPTGSFTFPSLSTIANLFGDPAMFSLEQMDGFPFAEWSRLQAAYKDNISWYTGDALRNEEVGSDGEQLDLYPLKMNPIPGTCEKHAEVLLGEVMESISNSGLPISVKVSCGDDDSAKEKGKKLSATIEKCLRDSGFSARMLKSAMSSQYLGCAIMGVRWNIVEGFTVRDIEPTEFVCFPFRDDLYRLREAWVVRTIDYREALSLGYKPQETENDASPYYYAEFWNEEQYRIMVNGTVVVVDGKPATGVNPWGIVPFVYIPHIRTKGFYGNSLITEPMKGFVREMNLRNADIGDAVNEDAHSPIAIRNTRSLPSIKKLGGILTVVDLGTNSGISQGEKEPDMISVSRSSTSEPMLKFSDRVDRYYRREANHPAVADGEDEGSQRSSLTLTTRMFPLVSHAKLERMNWTEGLTRLFKIMLRMMAVKSFDGVSVDDWKSDIYVAWMSMLSKDREALVSEVTNRRAAKALSRRHAVELMGDVFDVDIELALIEEEESQAAEQQLALTTAKAESMGDDEFGGNPGEPGAKAGKPNGGKEKPVQASQPRNNGNTPEKQSKQETKKKGE